MAKAAGEEESRFQLGVPLEERSHVEFVFFTQEWGRGTHGVIHHSLHFFKITLVGEDVDVYGCVASCVGIPLTFVPLTKELPPKPPNELNLEQRPLQESLLHITRHKSWRSLLQSWVKYSGILSIVRTMIQ